MNAAVAFAEPPPLNLTNAWEQIFCSPDQDVKHHFLNFVSRARKSIHLLIFGFHIPELTELLITKHQAGLVVDCIFDHSQAQGKAEAPELLKLMQAGVPFLIGTSWVKGQILHSKVTVIDDEWVEDGSWNYSESATQQGNIVRFTHSPQLAHIYLREFDKTRAYIIHHEQIFQPHAEVTPAPALTEDVGRDAELDPKPDAGQVHRADLAAPWLDNPPIAVVSATGGNAEASILAPKPRTRKRKVRAEA